LDPVRIEVKGKPTTDAKVQQSAIEKNKKNLIGYCNSIFESVLGLMDILPMSMRVILADIKKNLLAQFDGEMAAVYAGVTAFLFLRFVAPAISQPTVFGLTTNHPSKDASRTLMLCAITLQKLSNLKEFGDGKEPHMMVMNEWIKKSIPKMKDFLDKISDIPLKAMDAIPVDHVAIDYGREMAVVAGYMTDCKDQLYKIEDPAIPLLKNVMYDLEICWMAFQKRAI